RRRPAPPARRPPRRGHRARPQRRPRRPRGRRLRRGRGVAGEAHVTYEAFAARLRATGVLSDPWLDGAPRFEEAPVVLGPEEAAALAESAEAVVAALNELVRILVDEPALLDRLGLTPYQRIMWHASAPHWHGIARADAFFTADGVQICEVNSDTPSGEAEAGLLNRPPRARGPGRPHAGLPPPPAALV